MNHWKDYALGAVFGAPVLIGFLLAAGGLV
ncbi:Uncharacterised protein [Corynebacterium minutissimum]|uniref:Uncharacterized protein n=1 Tax=Corynebacterium minutissimum TaxID=38301 RepID=A0A376CY55_9CORY|nr:Uncharacterised protein [Corynebacterium minutissimum]